MRNTCKHLYRIETRNYLPVLVCMHCGKAVADPNGQRRGAPARTRGEFDNNRCNFREIPQLKPNTLEFMPYWDETHQTALQRDQMIVDLRKRGYTIRRIAKHVHMSVGGVYEALQRIQAGRPGRTRS